jgi:hypothetical protein
MGRRPAYFCSAAHAPFQDTVPARPVWERARRHLFQYNKNSVFGAKRGQADAGQAPEEKRKGTFFHFSSKKFRAPLRNRRKLAWRWIQ